MTKPIKLIYIYTSAAVVADSVQTKITAQIDALNKNGIDCKGLFFSTSIDEAFNHNEYIQFIPCKATHYKYFNLSRQKKVVMNTISDYVDQNVSPDALIYIRYPGVSFSLYRFSIKNKGRIISEHISKEIDEYKSFKSEFPFGLRPSKLISYIQYMFLPIFNERIWGRLYRKNTKSIVAESLEVALYQVKRGATRYFVNSNGIDTKIYTARAIPPLEKEIKILFLKGTSSIAQWNGIDRLINSLDLFENTDYKIKLIICGKIIENEIPEREYIHLAGYLSKEALDKLFSEVHFGISTLCLFRKKLDEIAGLKTREYMIRGLPFLYAYTDPDIEENKYIQSFCLKYPNDDTLIDFNDVINFVEVVYRNVRHAQEMHDWATKHIDWDFKKEKMAKFIRELN
ncbi:MAG: hypothetical protein V4613_10530 [Bacteroidota bacterium]